MKRVLFAHQSTIPHYRIPFYSALERRHTPDWSFDVVYDPQERRSQRFFKESIHEDAFAFPTLEVRTWSLRWRGKALTYQTFWRAAGHYDLVIVENALNNLTYPLCRLHRLSGVKLAYWGHDRHIGAGPSPGLPKRIAERLKRRFVDNSSGFFAYTEPMRQRLIDSGLAADCVFAVNNTIDLLAQRQLFEQTIGEREALRQAAGFSGKKVLLLVGRLTPNKRIAFLLEAFAHLYARDRDYALVIVGGGAPHASQQEGVSFYGPITDARRLAELYVSADLFAFPGAVGLGPLQALCYDLPAVVIRSPIHGPEFDYLGDDNTVVLPATTTCAEYADVLDRLFAEPQRLQQLRAGAWPSISHLTIENMADRFAAGIESLLAK